MSKKGVCLNTGKTHFKKGNIPWNKGKKVQSNTGRTHFKKGMNTWNKGKKFPERSGERHHNWVGGRVVTLDGYIWVLCREHPCAHNGYVYEHRLVMERKLGRYLESNEIIHHINKNKSDNREENLEMSNRKEHINIHRDSLYPEEINV